MRLPYGIYKAAQAEALRQKQERAIEQAQSLSANATTNLAAAKEAIADRFTMRKRMRVGSMSMPSSQETYMGQGLYSGRGAYGVRKFGRDFKAIVPKSIRHQMEQSILQGMTGQGLYSGRGAYNVLVDGGRTGMQFGSDNDETQSLCISHTEYLQDVYGAADSSFSVESWALNPSLPDNFPWLAQIAANYEEYEFIQLLFHYKSTVDTNATNNNNGATGTIIMATNYNANAPNFTNKEVMMQYHGSNSGRVVEDHTHGVECDPDKNAGSAQKFTRVGPVAANQDLKTYDLGTFQLGQVNLPTAFRNQQIGELWVTYTVKLTKPRLFAALGGLGQEFRLTASIADVNNSIPGTQTTAGSGPLGALAGTYVQNGPSQNNVTNPWSGLVANAALYPGAGTTWKEITGTTAVLTMQQSAIPIRVEQSSQQSGNNINQPIVNAIRITFPDFVTGVYEIQMFMEGTDLALNSSNVIGSGSVTPYRDLTPTRQSSTAASFWQNVVQGSTYSVWIIRVRVAPITAGDDNQLILVTQWSINNPQGTFTGQTCNTQLIVRQVNPFLGRNTATPLPYYLNSAGTIVEPPAF